MTSENPKDLMAFADWLETIVDEPEAVRMCAKECAKSVRILAMTRRKYVVHVSPPPLNWIAETIEFKLPDSPLTEAQREIARWYAMRWCLNNAGVEQDVH